jgi:hypothetical protein
MSRARWMAAIALAVACMIQGCATDAADSRAGLRAQQAFFGELAGFCGETFGGRAILAPESDQIFEPERLSIHFEHCTVDTVRVRFTVGDDSSRVWLFTFEENGRLRFTHERRAEDGTEFGNSGHGGLATLDGRAHFQNFPNHRAPEGTPYEELGIWRLRVDRDHGQFVYYLDEGDRPRWRLVFHLGPPSPAG